MDKSVPWPLPVDLASLAVRGAAGAAPVPAGDNSPGVLCCLQPFFNPGDRPARDILYDMPAARRFAGLSCGRPMPDETTMFNFRRPPELHVLGEAIFNAIGRHLESKGFRLSKGRMVDATIVAAPSLTKNKERARDPEMHSTQKGRRQCFGMKLRIGVEGDGADAQPGQDVGEQVVRRDGGGASARRRGAGIGQCRLPGGRQAPGKEGLHIDWKIARGRGKRKMPGKGGPEEAEERRKASVRARVEHPFRWLKRCFKCSKVRCRGLYRNRQRMAALLGVTNLIMAGRHAAA